MFAIFLLTICSNCKKLNICNYTSSAVAYIQFVQIENLVSKILVRKIVDRKIVARKIVDRKNLVRKIVASTNLKLFYAFLTSE